MRTKSENQSEFGKAVRGFVTDPKAIALTLLVVPVAVVVVSVVTVPGAVLLAGLAGRFIHRSKKS